MLNNLGIKNDPRHPIAYQIRIKGHLDSQWTDWFEGLTITLEDNGDTILTGPVIDQAALHGLLKKVRDLGMPLVSVHRIEPRGEDRPKVTLFTSVIQQRTGMNINKLTARITGVLFILGFAGILTAALTRSILGDTDYLSKISANENPVIWGALFQFIMGAACAGIGISLYPILKKYNEGLALGSAGFRIIEGGIYIIGVIGLFLLLTLSREFAKAGHPDPSYFQITGTLLLSLRDWVLLTGTMAWCIGALIYYSIFYQTKLIPRWLSGWGLVGIVLAWVAGMLVMFHLDTSMSTLQGMLNLPIALQEMTLAIWLIVRGFDPSAISFGSAKVEMN